MVRFDGRSFITNDARFVRSAVRWQPVDAGILASSWRAGAGPGGVRSCTGSQPMEQVINVKPPPPPARTATLIRASTGAHRQTDRQTDTATMIYVLRSFLLRRAAYTTAVRIAEVH